jgi:hypothetical protein
MSGDVVDRAIVAPQARDISAATRLWQTCEDLTGIEFLSSPKRPALSK